MRTWIDRLRAWLGRERLEADIAEQMRFHVEARAADLARGGIAPEEALRRARLEFGSRERYREESREALGFRLCGELRLDVRYAVRSLRRSPGFLATAVTTLALGIGATTAIFSVVNGVLLNPLPYRDADRLVRIVENVPAEESFRGVAMRLPAMSPGEFVWWREQVTTLSHMAITMPESHTLMLPGSNLRLAGARISAAMFPMSGLAPVAGRGFTDQEERSAEPVVALSERTWRRYFGGDPGLVSRTIVMDDRTYTVVGIMPDIFGDAAFWMPYTAGPEREGTVTYVPVTARLADGVGIEGAAAEINALGHRLRGATLEPGGPVRFELSLVLDETVARARPALRVLMVGAAAVLLIVCANVANLLLTRGSRRQQEIATRRALGAGRARVARQMLTESLVLAAMGGVAGVGLAYGGVALLKSLALVELPAEFGPARGLSLLPRVAEVAIDQVVLAFALGAAMLSGLVFGLAPALRLSGSPNSGSARVAGRTRVGRLLAAGQLALATPLLVGAGLLLHSFVKLTSVDLGFDAEHTLHFDLVLPDHYVAERKLALAEELAARLEEMPGVVAAGYSDGPPLSSRDSMRPYGGYDPPYKEPREEGRMIEQRSISTGYLRALGVPLIAGRWLEDRDWTVRPPGILVSESYARYYFGGAPAVGAILPTRSGPAEVVGVVGDVRFSGPEDEAPLAGYADPRLLLAFSDEMLAARGRVRGEPGNRLFLSGMSGAIGYAVRTSGDPVAVAADVQRLVREVDPSAAADSVMRMENVVGNSSAQPRFYAVLVGLFGFLAAVVAGVGVYGVLAYVVAQRTQEIGIRMALGAERGEVLALVLRQGATLAAVGLTVGLAGAVGLTRYLSGMLFGLTPLDVPTYAAVAVLFAAIAMGASYLPARRATRVDPIQALRHD